ncbi:hypothetical protein ACMSD2_24550, partial [Bacteroides thetaiotaomicron]
LFSADEEEIIRMIANDNQKNCYHQKAMSREENVIKLLAKLKYNNKYESQLLRLFDFTAWMESKIRKEKLSEVLRVRTSAKEC